jgi:hypothetical protein
MSIFTTEQQVLDHVTDHLRQQKKQSIRYVNGFAVCAYRGAAGMKCAIGSCIPDELYRPGMDPFISGSGLVPEGMQVDSMKSAFPEEFAAVFGSDIRLQFLHDLQVVHDIEPSLDGWEKELERLAYQYCLEYRAPTNTVEENAP